MKSQPIGASEGGVHSPARLDHVHALRGVAALAVVVQHAAQVAQEAGAGIYRPLLETVNLGRFGVLLFFLVSGLVVPFSLRGSRPLRDFAIGRFFRLFPAYWLSLPILTFVAVKIGLPHDPATVLANLTMLQSLFGFTNIGPGYWTLTFELGFYALAALLAWRGRLGDAHLLGAGALFALGLALAPALHGQAPGGFLPVLESPFFVALFLVGMVLRLGVVDGHPAARRWAAVLVPAAALAGVLLGGALFPVIANRGPYFHPFALTTAMALPVPVFAAVLLWRPAPGRVALWLGTVSYSVYLFQDAALRLLPDAINPGAAPLAYLGLVMAITLAVAALVWTFVEAPMIALGKRIVRSGKGAQAARAMPIANV